LRTCVRDNRTVDCFVIAIRLPRLDDVAACATRRPSHHHEEAFHMTERIKTPLAVKLPGILALEHGIVEHDRRTDEIDAVLGDILLAARLLPLEH
jgi:hypothetical protein